MINKQSFEQTKSTQHPHKPMGDTVMTKVLVVGNRVLASLDWEAEIRHRGHMHLETAKSLQFAIKMLEKDTSIRFVILCKCWDCDDPISTAHQLLRCSASGALRTIILPWVEHDADHLNIVTAKDAKEVTRFILEKASAEEKAIVA